MLGIGHNGVAMLHFGGTATVNNVVVYIGSNSEKFLLGRFWGAGPLGLYGRAYQLVNLPFQQLSLSMFQIIFPALSRIQNDPERLCRFFLKSYSLILSICIPVALSSVLFSKDIIPVILGPKWNDSIPILQILAPTIIASALTYPFGWLLLATNRVLRGLRISLMVTPMLILGIAVGLPYGPTGVATGYTLAQLLLIVPAVAWAKKDTGISSGDVWRAIKSPIKSGVIAAIAGILFSALFESALPQVPRLILELAIVVGTYFSILLFGMGQWSFYSGLLTHFTKGR